MPTVPAPAAPCPTSAELSQFAARQLDPAVAARVQTHLASCATCRHVVDESRANLRSEFATLDTPAPAPPKDGASTVSLAGATDQRGPAKKPPSVAASAGLERYRLGEEIARGGMGVVHRATDLLFKREVAIKLLHPKLQNNPQALEAFRYEAEITARLQHPGIPPIHDLGVLPDGRPLLAMKLIQGKTLHELLKARESLSDDLPRWLQIFEQIAQAVGYAHSQNIIHRDLKPLNVMVGEFGEVQVMDWGLAKVIGGGERPSYSADEIAERERQFISRQGDVKGTLAYMPPEQARGEIDDLDPRSDVFGLGAILCQMLTGEPPYCDLPSADLERAAAAGEIKGALARIRACGADAELIELAAQCLSPRKLGRPADGSAVARAVANYRASIDERLRQAETERALAQQRLVDQARRRKLWYATAAVSFLLAFASTIAAVVYARANRLIAAGEGKYRNEAAIRGAVNDFLQRDLLTLAGADDQADARLRVDPELKVRELVLRAATRIEGRFPGQPLVEASIRHTLGVSLSNVGEYQQAIAQHHLAKVIFERELGEDHPDTASCLSNLAMAYDFAGQPAKAIPLFERAISARREQGGDDSSTFSLMNGLAIAYQNAGKIDQALQLYQESHKKMEAAFGPDHKLTIAALGNLALGYSGAGEPAKATPLFEKAHRLATEKLGADHPQTIQALHNLANAYGILGRLDESIELQEQALSTLQQQQGNRHPLTMVALLNLGSSYLERGEPDRAAKVFEELLPLQVARLGATHPHVIATKTNLSSCYVNLKQPERSILLLESILESYQATGADDELVSAIVINLATAYGSADQPQKSLRLLEDAVVPTTEKLGRTHPTTLSLLHNLGNRHLKDGQLTKAEVVLTQVHAGRVTVLGKDHFETLRTLCVLARCQIELEKFDVAQANLEMVNSAAISQPLPLRTDVQIRVAELFVDLHTKTAMPAELENWRQKLDRLRANRGE